MRNRFPLFEGGRILKKEGLWDIRDYSYGGWQLYYSDYSDGLLKGCRIRAEDGFLVIGTGMIKFHNFIYLLQEETRVAYEAKDEWVALKAEFTEDSGNPDYQSYQVSFFLDGNMELGENQIEMCRFYLRRGSKLRDSYKGYYDMVTEYDTIQLIDATVAGEREPTLHPAVLMQFASEMAQSPEKEPADYAFYYMVLGRSGEICRKVIMDYLADKGRGDRRGMNREFDNRHLYRELENILENRKQKRGSDLSRKMIYVD